MILSTRSRYRARRVLKKWGEQLTGVEEALARGDALSSEIVNTAWRTRLGYVELPEIPPLEAGKKLARISRQVDLTFFAHYTTDYAGHRGKVTYSDC